MKITRTNAAEIGPELVERWLALQRSNPQLASPFFHPSFLKCVARVKRSVEVAVIEDRGEVVGVFPFERSGLVLGVPAGNKLSDYHGIVGASDLELDPTELLRACKLIAWDFTHVPMSQSFVKAGIRQRISSPYLDLTQGYDAYESRLAASGSDLSKRVAYLERRLVREVGAIRYTVHERNADVIDQILAWKRQKYSESGSAHAHSTSALLRNIHSMQSDSFAGILSTLHAGDRLIAGHFGMRSQDSWHYWFPSYDAEFSKYSPGLILILKMARSAAGLGVRMIDLGGGRSQYKDRLANSNATLFAGSIESPGFQPVRNAGRSIVTSLRKTPCKELARSVARKYRFYRSRWS